MAGGVGLASGMRLQRFPCVPVPVTVLTDMVGSRETSFERSWDVACCGRELIPDMLDLPLCY